MRLRRLGDASEWASDPSQVAYSQIFDPATPLDPAGAVDARGLIDKVVSFFSPNAGSTGASAPRPPVARAPAAQPHSHVPIILLAAGAAFLLMRKRK